ncbi:MAG TPA: hypothetical protein DCY12_06665 [Candidatus Atribacteria bacterium]|nr:hypothetical protein [Candidatus Atribacteria bacterium]
MRQAEEFYAGLMNNAPTPIVVINPDGSIRYVSPALEKLTSFSLEEVIGRKPPYPWWAEETMEKTSEDFKEAFHKGFQGVKELFKKKNEERFWVEVTSTPVRRNGELKYYLLTLVDITERIKTEDGLRESEQRYRSVIDNIGIGVAVISPAMEILTLNNQMKRWFPAIDATQKPICYRSFNHPPRESICPYCPTSKTLRDGGVHENITDTLSGDEIINYRIISSPIKNKAGNVIAAIEMVENITEQKRLKQVLRESETKYRTLYESSYDAIMLLTPEEGFLGGNPAAIEMFGCANEKEFISQSPASLSPKYQPDGIRSSIKAQQMMARALEKGTYFFEWKHRRLNGAEFFSTVLLTRMELNGKNVLQATVRDITDRKLAEQTLIERQKQLEAQTKDLEEINTTLKVLLKKREEDKKELEEKVFLYTKELIEPYIEKLKKSGLNDNQKAYVSILESNLKNIISPVTRTLFAMYLHFTSAEIKIASLIKQGKTTKEIASLLNLAAQTIESHRKNIRKKLGIRSKKINLRTHLNTLQ